MDVRHEKNTPYFLTLPMISQADPNLFLDGQAASLTVLSYTREVDGAWVLAAPTNAVFDMPAGSGEIALDLTADDMNHDYRDIIISGPLVASTSIKFCMLPVPTFANISVGTLIGVAQPASRIGDPFIWEAFQGYEKTVSVAVYVVEADGSLTPVDLTGRSLQFTVFEDVRPAPATKFVKGPGDISISGTPVPNIAQTTLTATDTVNETGTAGPWIVVLQDQTGPVDLANGQLTIRPATAS